MARPLRLDFAGATWHLHSRGNNRRKIFFDDQDREHFLDLIGQTVRRYKWVVHEYELMTNHYHLVIDTPEATLSRGMQFLNGRYAQWFNKRHKRTGHLFEGRFHGHLVEKDAELLNVCRYVALNCVRARMVKQPEDYLWGSYRAHAGLAEAPWWLATNQLLDRFAPDRKIAQGLYRTFVHDPIGDSRRIWNNLVGQIYLGSNEWIKKMGQRVESKPRSDEHPRRQREIGRPAMSAIVEATAQAFKTKPHVIRKRGGSQARRVAAWLGCYEGRASPQGSRLRFSWGRVTVGVTSGQGFAVRILESITEFCLHNNCKG